MRFVSFTGLNRDWQPILTRRQRTGRGLRKRAWRTVGLIEIDHQMARRIRWIDIKVASGGISILAARLVSDDHEEARLVLLCDRIQPVFLAVYFKLNRAG